MFLQELNLVDALGDMVRSPHSIVCLCLPHVIQEIASKLITGASINVDDDGNPLNPLDAHFRSLGLTSMDPVARNSWEFAGLASYISDTHGQTHHFNASILHAFRVEREAETSAWLAKGYDKLAPGDRMLLWHGSRTTNFAGKKYAKCSAGRGFTVSYRDPQTGPPDCPSGSTCFRYVTEVCLSMIYSVLRQPQATCLAKVSILQM